MAEEQKTPKNKPLDLDFSDVEGEKKSKSRPADVLSEKPKKKKKKAKKEKKLSGLMLTIRKGKGYVSKDLVECTAEEFLEWAKSVYPQVTVPAEKFESMHARAMAFQQIQQYHLSTMTKEQRETIH